MTRWNGTLFLLKFARLLHKNSDLSKMHSDVRDLVFDFWPATKLMLVVLTNERKTRM